MANSWEDFLEYFDQEGGGLTTMMPDPPTPSSPSSSPVEASGTDLNSGSVDVPNERPRDPRLIGEYRSWYRDPDSGERYEGSAKGVRDKIVAAKMAENEASGKYNKKRGWFKEFRGAIERDLDKNYGGDWDPYDEDKGSIRGHVKEGINKNERQFLANEGVRIGNIALDEQKETTENKYQDFQKWMEKFSSGGKGFHDTPEYITNDPPETDIKEMQKNANAADEVNKKKYYRDENMQLQEAGDEAREGRIESAITDMTPGEALENNQVLGTMTGRFKVEAGDGSKLTYVSDDKYGFFHDPKSGLIYDKDGNTTGYSSAPGKYHHQEPDKPIAGWGVNIGELKSPETTNKESLLYPYGGQTPVKGADPGAYFDKYGGGPDTERVSDGYEESNEMVKIKEDIKKKTSDFTMEQGSDGKMHKKYKRSKEDEDMSTELERVARAAGWDGSDSSWITDPLQHDMAGVMSSSGKPYHPMDLGGNEGSGPNSWGWRGRPYNPYARKGDKSLGHKKIKEPPWITATRKYYQQRQRN